MQAGKRDGMGSKLALQRLLPRLFEAGDAVCKAIPALEQTLDPRRLLAAGRRRAGPAWNPEVAAALGALATSLEAEASLSLFGRVSTRWDVRRLLTNLKRMQQEENADPSIREEPI